MIEGKQLKVQVLDKGYVELEDYMGGDSVIVKACHTCYGKPDSGDPDADARLIERVMLAVPRHNTVFEHAVFRFGVKCPIFVARQWLRLRVGTFSERSLRWCVADREYYVPADEPAADRYIAHMEASFDLYEALVASGWRKERARGVLGTAVYTDFVWSVNFWSLCNWMEKRLDPAAQWEHREYGHGVLDIVHQVMPISTRAFVASLPAKTKRQVRDRHPLLVGAAL